MGKTKVKESKKPLTLSKVVVYILLILLAITIIIPVGWVFVASVKQNSEFYGSPWVLPEKIYFQNFIDAWGEGEHGNLHAQLSDRNSACIAFADRDLSSGGICIVQIQV